MMNSRPCSFRIEFSASSWTEYLRSAADRATLDGLLIAGLLLFTSSSGNVRRSRLPVKSQWLALSTNCAHSRILSLSPSKGPPVRLAGNVHAQIE